MSFLGREDMNEPAAFFSYVQADDEHDGGNLTRLRNRLAAEVRMQTGEEFLIFQDRDDILWGQRWQSRIERTIDASTLLIAVVTPAFLRSEPCRGEVQRFLERERALGRDDLILPIHYVDTPRLADDDDEIAKELRSRQWVDWRELRFEPFDAPAVRQALARLAGEAVNALQREQPMVSPVPTPRVSEDEDDEPGFVELVAEAEDAMPLFTNIIEEFSEQMNGIAMMARAATEDLDSSTVTSRPASARLARVRRLAQDLDEPAASMERLAEEYREQLSRVDGGIGAMARQIPTLTSSEEIAAARELHAALDVLAQQGGAGLDALDRFSSVVAQTGRLSRTVRPVFRRIIGAANKISSTKGTLENWERDVRESLAQLPGPQRDAE